MAKDYDRYEILKNSDGSIDMPPFVEIPVASSDKYEVWREGYSRFDIFASKYYNNPFDDFLIGYANPKYISEFDIPHGTIIRIPFPLDRAKFFFENNLTKIKNS